MYPTLNVFVHIARECLLSVHKLFIMSTFGRHTVLTVLFVEWIKYIFIHLLWVLWWGARLGWEGGLVICSLSLHNG